MGGKAIINRVMVKNAYYQTERKDLSHFKRMKKYINIKGNHRKGQPEVEVTDVKMENTECRGRAL